LNLIPKYFLKSPHLKLEAQVSQPSWMSFAWRDFGVKEIKGRRDETRIVKYFRAVGHSKITDDETAWCAAFVGACLEQAGIASTRSLMARSYLKWGRPLKRPVPGCIAVLSRGANPKLGHVGFFLRETKAGVVLLGEINATVSVSTNTPKRAYSTTDGQPVSTL